MLVRYRDDYQKIVLGLLSFSPDLNNYDRLREEIDWNQSDVHPLYLWKSPYADQFVGVAVLEVGKEYVLLRRLSFTPSERSGKNVYQFLSAIADKYAPKRLMGTLATQPLITNWERSRDLRIKRGGTSDD